MTNQPSGDVPAVVAAATDANTCQYPAGCAKDRASREGARGPRPKYCLEVDADGVEHNPQTAWAWIQKHQAEETGRTVSDMELQNPVTAARLGVQEDIQRLTKLMTDQRVAAGRALDRLATIGNPVAHTAETEMVKEDARRRIEAASQAARDALDRAERANRDRQTADEAATSMQEERNEANRRTELAENQVREVRRQAAADAEAHAAELTRAQREAQERDGQVRAEADETIRQVKLEAGTMVNTAREEAEQTVAGARAEASRLVQAAETTLEEAARAAEVAREQATQARQETAGANARVTAVTDELGRARDGFGRDLAAARADTQRERERADRLDQEVRAAATEAARMQLELTEARAEAGSATGRAEHAEREASRLSGELAAARNKGDQLASELRNETAEAAGLREQLAVAKERAAAAEREAAEMRARSERLTVEQAQSRQQAAADQAQMRDLYQGRLDDAAARAARAESELDRLRNGKPQAK